MLLGFEDLSVIGVIDESTTKSVHTLILYYSHFILYSLYYIHLHDKRASLKSQHTPSPQFTVQGYTADTYDQTSLTQLVSR